MIEWVNAGKGLDGKMEVHDLTATVYDATLGGIKNIPVCRIEFSIDGGVEKGWKLTIFSTDSQYKAMLPVSTIANAKEIAQNMCKVYHTERANHHERLVKELK